MKIGFLSEYFYPFEFGGSEISTFLLAKKLSQKNIKITVIAPNFGAKTKEEIGEFNVVRYFFPVKVKDRPLAPFWHTSMLLNIYRAIIIYLICKRNRIDLIHVQEKYLLPAGAIAAKVLGIPLVITLRDYQALCSLGFCVNEKRDYKKCGFFFYLLREAPIFLKKYSAGKNPFLTPIKYMFLLRGRVIAAIYSYFITWADQVICISQKQKSIYEKNGHKNISVIYNIAEFLKEKKEVKKGNYVLYVGKQSLGKGTDLLYKAAGILERKFPKIVFKLIGQQSESVSIKTVPGNINIIPWVPNEELSKIYRKALLTVVPSRWEEPFGRVALESLSTGTPVVAANKGGLPEIVQNGLTGLIVDPNSKKLARAIENMLNKLPKFEKNVKAEQPDLKKKFLTDPIYLHIRLYHSLLK